MPETTSERIAALVGVVAAVTLILVALSARTEERAVPVAAAVSGETALPQAAVPLDELDEPVAAAARPPAAPTKAALALTATRGDCWLSVRADAEDGEVLYEGTLAAGRTMRFARTRLWVRMGAAANLDLTLNGKKVAALPAATAELVATPAGVQPGAGA